MQVAFLPLGQLVPLPATLAPEMQPIAKSGQESLFMMIRHRFW
jgi:hypothetical protein